MDIKRKIASILLDFAQKRVNQLYEYDGLSDDVLNHQLKINEFRNKLNIPDQEEIITNDGFVQ